jgi:DNA-binding phage protein
MAMYEAIERVRGHTKVYRTVKNIMKLNDFVASGRSMTEIASHFDTTVEELEQGFRKLRKQATEIHKTHIRISFQIL